MYNLLHVIVVDKKWANFSNILDIATQVVRSFSVHQAPSNEASFSLLASVLTKLAYFGMLFILALVQAGSRINYILR